MRSESGARARMKRQGISESCGRVNVGSYYSKTSSKGLALKPLSRCLHTVRTPSRTHPNGFPTACAEPAARPAQPGCYQRRPLSRHSRPCDPRQPWIKDRKHNVEQWLYGRLARSMVRVGILIGFPDRHGALPLCSDLDGRCLDRCRKPSRDGQDERHRTLS